ncbi:hypothetical protein AAC387_Pa03g0302 [Persea americana]
MIPVPRSYVNWRRKSFPLLGGILLLSSMGFPTEFFPVLFAIPRMAGYLSHWRESLDDPDSKIMRPQQVPSSSHEENEVPMGR